MRKTDEVYWTTSLPKDHLALQTLDRYCKEWGGLSRAEATRRLLIEWNKVQQGQPVSAWLPTSTSQSAESVAREQVPRAGRTLRRSSLADTSAQEASKVLDEY